METINANFAIIIGNKPASSSSIAHLFAPVEERCRADSVDDDERAFAISRRY